MATVTVTIRPDNALLLVCQMVEVVGDALDLIPEWNEFEVRQLSDRADEIVRKIRKEATVHAARKRNAGQ